MNRPVPPNTHAVYATCQVGGERVTFRVGLPVSWDRAIARWYRLDDRRFKFGRSYRVRHGRRWYSVEFFEVRSTDRHGRGLGEPRHETALPVPYRRCLLAS